MQIGAKFSVIPAGLFASLLAGCLSMSPQPRMDFTGPGWTVQQGQVVWRSSKNAAGVAGELLVALHPDGRSVVQFTKTPLPFIVAQRSTKGWQAEIVPQHKIYSAPGSPPARLIWLQLPECIRTGGAPKGFVFLSKPGGGWRLERSSTGENLEGYLDR